MISNKINYKLYHYNMNNFNDVGFGCSYRNLQTILSCYKTNYPSKFDKVDINNKDIPDIRELLYYFNNDYQNKIDKYITRDLWIVPVQIAEYLYNNYNIKYNNVLYILEDKDISNMLKTDISSYFVKNDDLIFDNNIYNHDDFDKIINLFIQHFNKSKLSIVIDNGIYSYCIGDIKEDKIFIIDPHTTTGDNIIKIKDLKYIENSFWMIYLPIV